MYVWKTKQWLRVGRVVRILSLRDWETRWEDRSEKVLSSEVMEEEVIAKKAFFRNTVSWEYSLIIE